MMRQERSSGAFFTSPFGGEVGAQRRVRGALANSVTHEDPLTRPKRVDLSPQGEVKGASR
ncbi:MAG: hypothetical protein ABS76_04095 [Pelagibacterium sp. SCN 64-44]|nr:MAG: hypothetical protein ABS76_04095 [Pelagibacterium sp. SCN 64-44]